MIKKPPRSLWIALITASLAGGIAAMLPDRREPPASLVESQLPAPSMCRDVGFEGQDFIVCPVDPETHRIVVADTRSLNPPIDRLAAMSDQIQFDFATNGGMYHEDMSPVGLLVVDGVEAAPLNTGDAPGNFFMKPNGVFFVDRSGKPGVLETGGYFAAKPQVQYATQSGPMLVIDGAIHARFETDGASRYIRNGVGIDGGGRAVFAISRAPVSLGKFARLFRDSLACGNALFFDGAISTLHDGKSYVVGGQHSVGPVVAVIRREAAATQ